MHLLKTMGTHIASLVRGRDTLGPYIPLVLGNAPIMHGRDQ
jgi:hypothetical protein